MVQHFQLTDLGMRKPFAIVVTGRPASGKTTLAHRLAKQIRCPALCRDEFKEGYVHALNSGDRFPEDAVNRRVNDIFFETVEFVISKGISVVIEAAFQHKLWATPLTALAETASVSIIVCTIDPHLARSRYIQRAKSDAIRERFHGNLAAAATKDGLELPVSEYHPPEVGLPTLFVDTTDGYNPDLDEITAFAQQQRD